MPNLQTEPDGTKLAAGQAYEFSFEDSAFVKRPDAPYGADAIKFLRIMFSGNEPHVLAKVQGSDALTLQCLPLVSTMRQAMLRV
jgi:hypothetical protein